MPARDLAVLVEKCAATLEGEGYGSTAEAIRAELRSALSAAPREGAAGEAAAMREACAKVCERQGSAFGSHDYDAACRDCAAAIRALPAPSAPAVAQTNGPSALASDPSENPLGHPVAGASGAGEIRSVLGNNGPEDLIVRLRYGDGWSTAVTLRDGDRLCVLTEKQMDALGAQALNPAKGA